MSKEIRYERSELVWQTRVIYWGSKDWDNLKTWVKLQVEKAQMPENKDGGWYQSFIQIYDIIKDMSWDDAMNEYEKWDKGEHDALYWNETTTYNNGETHTSKYYFGDWLREQMQEDLYNTDICSEDYADDYDEDIRIVEEEGNNN